MFWLARRQEQIIADTQLNIEEVRSETAFQRLLKPPNQFLFLRKKSKDIFSMSQFLKTMRIMLVIIRKYSKRQLLDTYI